MNLSAINVYTPNTSSDSPGYMEGTMYRIGNTKFVTLSCVGKDSGFTSTMPIPKEFCPIAGNTALRFWETGRDIGASSMSGLLDTN